MPEQPTLPEKPTLTNPNNLKALQLYISELDTYNADVTTLQENYNDEVTKQQDDYKAEIDQWQQENEDYKDAFATYQKDLTELKVKRAVAIGAAESTIENYKDDFGWTFVDKQDKASYPKAVFVTWAALLVIILVLLAGTIFMVKKRDVV